MAQPHRSDARTDGDVRPAICHDTTRPDGRVARVSGRGTIEPDRSTTSTIATSDGTQSIAPKLILRTPVKSGSEEETMTRFDGVRLITTSVFLSLVGLSSTLGSMWVPTHDVRGQALHWVTWLSVLGAVVAVPIASSRVGRSALVGPERRR